MAASTSQSTLPQGFSVFQPSLGAQLQFFPALGSQQLDDMINAFIPGAGSIKDKRATVTVDFLEYSHMTGQNFKFYPVMVAATTADSPAAVSPSLDSASSSFNVSPVTSSWDWSAAASTSSQSSTQRRRHSSKASPPSRHQTTTDFSSLPGMKILTKDGLDVTNSASRGSKTKEQRDHAHLMRIIKACDSCRRKKIRCDPSHKKRGAPQPQAATGAAAASAVAKPAKKQKTAAQEAPPPTAPQIHLGEVTDPSAMLLDDFSFTSFDLDSSLDFTALESLDATTAAWDEFVQFPPMDTVPDYDFFLDPENYFSQSSSASSSESPGKVLTPPQSQEVNATPGSDVNFSEPGAPPGGVDLYGPNAPPGGDVDGFDSQQSRSPPYPFLDQPGSAGSDYTDFNLYSPESTFSEDERMLPIGTSSSSLPNLNEPLISDCPPPLGVASGEDVGGWEAIARQFNAAGDDVGGMPYYDPGVSAAGDDNVHATSARVDANRPASVGGRVLICCPPGTVVMAEDGSDTRILDNVSTSLNVSGLSSTSPGLAASESPAVVDSVAQANASVSDERGSVSPALSQSAADAAVVARDGRRSEHPAAISAQDHVVAPASGADRQDQSAVTDHYVDGSVQRPRLRPLDGYAGDRLRVENGQQLQTRMATHDHLTGLAPVTASSVHLGQELGAASAISAVRHPAVDVAAAESPGDVSAGEQATASASTRASQPVLDDPGRHLAYRANDAHSRGPSRTYGSSLLYGQAVASTNVSSTSDTAVQSGAQSNGEVSTDRATCQSSVASPINTTIRRVSASAPVVVDGDSQTAPSTVSSHSASGNMAVAAAAVSAFVQYMHSVMASHQSSGGSPGKQLPADVCGTASRSPISDRTRAAIRSQTTRIVPMGAVAGVAVLG